MGARPRDRRQIIRGPGGPGAGGRNAMKRRHRHGLTLMELLMVIGLSTLFLNLVAELFHGTMQSTFDSQTIENQASRVDTAITALRQDAWQADGIKVAPGGQSAELNLSSGSTATWRVLSDGSVERDLAGASTRW